MALLLRLLLVAVALYTGLLILLFCFQRRLLFLPTRVSEAEVLQAARTDQLEAWRNSQGELIGWYYPNPAARRRLVVFHGNAGQALDRSYYVQGLASLGFEVYLFEYPGYGARAGSPSKKAFVEAGRAALAGLLATDLQPLCLLGESIGSGTACALAAEMPGQVAAVALVTPFARLSEVAQNHLRFLPVGWLLRDRFDNLAALAQYHGPVAFVVAGNDEVVGTNQGLRLYQAYAGPKELTMLPNAGHNQLPLDPAAGWWREVAAVLQR